MNGTEQTSNYKASPMNRMTDQSSRTGQNSPQHTKVSKTRTSQQVLFMRSRAMRTAGRILSFQGLLTTLVTREQTHNAANFKP